MNGRKSCWFHRSPRGMLCEWSHQPTLAQNGQGATVIIACAGGHVLIQSNCHCGHGSCDTLRHCTTFILYYCVVRNLAVAPAIDEPSQKPRKPCNCTKSRCLKLYGVYLLLHLLCWHALTAVMCSLYRQLHTMCLFINLIGSIGRAPVCCTNG